MGASYENDLIYDVGLHKGEDSEFYLKKGFRVVAIEALQPLAEAAEVRLRPYIENGQLIIVNVAVAEKDGPLTFFQNTGSSVWGTAYPDWAQRNQSQGCHSIETTVQGRNFANILSEYGIPYYLKIDVEGADILCIRALSEFEARPKHVSIESTKTSWKCLREEFSLFKSLGYTKFKVVPQHTVAEQRCPDPAKEGRYVDHRFEGGSSGLFGEEAPGNWLDEAEALRMYHAIFLRYRIFGDDGLLHHLKSAQRSLVDALGGSGKKQVSGAGEAQALELLSPPRAAESSPSRPPSVLRRFRPTVGWYDTHAMMP